MLDFWGCDPPKNPNRGVILLMLQKSGKPPPNMVVKTCKSSGYLQNQLAVWDFFHQQDSSVFVMAEGNGPPERKHKPSKHLMIWLSRWFYWFKKHHDEWWTHGYQPSSWWLDQPIWKKYAINVKLDPRYGVKRKHVWNQHLGSYTQIIHFSPMVDHESPINQKFIPLSPWSVWNEAFDLSSYTKEIRLVALALNQSRQTLETHQYLDPAWLPYHLWVPSKVSGCHICNRGGISSIQLTAPIFQFPLERGAKPTRNYWINPRAFAAEKNPNEKLFVWMVAPEQPPQNHSNIASKLRPRVILDLHSFWK